MPRTMSGRSSAAAISGAVAIPSPGSTSTSPAPMPRSANAPSTASVRLAAVRTGPPSTDTMRWRGARRPFGKRDEPRAHEARRRRHDVEGDADRTVGDAVEDEMRDASAGIWQE